jgi:hypothetical protein
MAMMRQENDAIGGFIAAWCGTRPFMWRALGSDGGHYRRFITRGI